MLIEGHCSTTLAHSGVFEKRQAESWDGNTKEWTGRAFGESQREARYRKKLKETVAKLSVVPLQSSVTG